MDYGFWYAMFMEPQEKQRLSRHNDMSKEARAIRLRAARLAAGLAQTDVAAAIGVTGGAIGEMESGRNPPSDAVMRFMFYEHRIDFNFLINGDYAQLPGDVQARLFPALEAANSEWERKASSGRRRAGRPPRQPRVEH